MKERMPLSGVEQYGEGRKRLLDLEKTGKFLFHGTSIVDLTELRPALPYTHEKGVRVPHGDRPTISATPSADMAIFYAVVTNDYREVNFEDKKPVYRATRKALDHAKTHTGYVYVVDRNEFAYPEGAYSLTEIRTDKSVKVLQTVLVTFDDLIKGVQELPPHLTKS